MDFDWDPLKAKANRAKHGVSFEFAQEVWDNPLHVTAYDRFEGGEHRYHALGLAGSILLLVVYAYPDPSDERAVRIISARRASNRERRSYEEGVVP